MPKKPDPADKNGVDPLLSGKMGIPRKRGIV
jgi:hypothetical protein